MGQEHTGCPAATGIDPRSPSGHRLSNKARKETFHLTHLKKISVILCQTYMVKDFSDS